MPMILHRLIVAAASGLCLAVAGIPALGAEHNLDGVYSGNKVLTRGSPNPSCPAKDSVSITIDGGTLTFTDSASKKFAHAFYPRPDGSFGETYTDEGGAIVEYHGHIVGDVIDADVTNTPCVYHWHLKKE